MPRRKNEDGPAYSGASKPADRDTYAFTVIGEELARAAFVAMGKAVKVTFGLTGTEHTLTEKRLGGGTLVDDIRRKLDSVGRVNRGERTLYFSKKFDGLDAEKPEAVYLASKGFSVTEVADALGITTQTLFRWGIRTPRPWFRLTDKFDDDDVKKLTAHGQAWMQKIAPNRKLSSYNDHYAMVGAARAYLKSYRKKNSKAA